ncbi:MAG TPA: riboflavin synthase [Chitinophagales bacterium]|nr:riboflavin synthase [Chitinophagales bacterium]
MFTGIIEAIGKIIEIRKEGSNIHFTIASAISSELKVDQSVSHDGVCLTVVKVEDNKHVVTAVKETLDRSAFKSKKEGDEVNLERSMLMNGRLDGHLVQGHVDDTLVCSKISEKDGSWLFRFAIKNNGSRLIVEKGSVCINGVSLTVAKLSRKQFSVAIIPYTHEHTTFKNLQPGDEVNIEYDIIGKYVARMMGGR